MDQETYHILTLVLLVIILLLLIVPFIPRR